MNRAVAAAVIVFAVAGTTAVYAHHWPGRWLGFQRFSSDDMSAFADARIAAVKAGLRLTPDQEKLWPPVEAAARDLAKQRIERISERRAEFSERHQREQRSPDELFDRFKRRADSLTATAAGLKKLADAAEPLYRSLNDDQKRRLVMLSRMGGMHHRFEHRRWNERTDDGGRDGHRFDRDRDRERGERPSMEMERL
jgi:hypothetical protein